MANFEEVGRKIDREVEKLRRYFEAEVRPSTERRLVAGLRAASKRLAQLAEEVDARAQRPPSAGEPR